MSSRLDIIIFGASGFTGLRTIPWITKMIKDDNLSLTWGVAGRSPDKIKNLLNELGTKRGENYDDVPIITADINDEESIKQMTSRARVIINATGPYRLYGEPVVKACLESSTHHIDVSGEAEFIEGMQLKYHEEAKKKGLFIISACGMDSIPAEMGIVFMQDNFKGTLNSVETYLSIKHENPNLPGPAVNTGTFNSAVHSLGNALSMQNIRSKLFKKKLPEVKPKVGMRLVHKSDLIHKWCLPIPEPDQGVIRRSQHFSYEMYNQRPIQIHCYVGLASFFYLMLALIGAPIFVLLCQFSWTRSLLLKYPKFFTLGFFGPEGPSDEKQESTLFKMMLRGTGWEKELKDPLEEPSTPPTKQIIAKVTGRNPGYGLTCAAFAMCAIIILTESNKMPKGGVITPSVAFAKTSMIEKLQNNGIKFEIISN